jgi:heat shock protein HslJ
MNRRFLSLLTSALLVALLTGCASVPDEPVVVEVPAEPAPQPEPEPAPQVEPVAPETVAFYGGVLPQQSGQDRILRMQLFDDGTARFATDFQDGRLPFLEVGIWEELADGVRLALTGTRRLIYDEPRLVEFENYVAGLIAVSYDSTYFGVRPMLLQDLPVAGQPLLEDTRWELLSLSNGEAVVEPTRYTLEFDETGMLTGRADCNRLSGQFVALDGEIELSPLAMTRAACPEGSIGNRYAAAVSAARGYSVDGDQLTLYNENGEIVADLVKSES